jgi:3-oxoacyl-(acyl-carrier-protein) synthase
MQRVLVTGAGVQGGLGDLDRTWQGLCRGQSAVRACRPDGEDYPDILGAPAAAFDLSACLPDRKMAKYMNPVTALTVAAAGMALESAGLVDAPCRREMALFVTTGLIAFDLSRVAPAMASCISAEKELDLHRMGSEGLALCNPLMPFKMLLNTPLGMVSIVFGIGGENFILYPGADQGGVAVQSAVQGIQSGRFQQALVGGGVQGLSLLPVATLDRLGRVARVSASDRTGWALCDAGAFVLLESEQAVAARHGRPLAEVAGVAMVHGDYRDPGDLENLLRQIALDGAPDGLLATGSLEEKDHARMRGVGGRIWTEAQPAMVNFDWHLGYAAAAAVPYLCALAAACLSREDIPQWTGLKRPRDLVVCSVAPEESLVAVRLRQPGGCP